MFKKTYESITANLRKLVQDLHDHADAHGELAADHFAQADEHMQAHRDALADADRARKTANKAAALLD